MMSELTARTRLCITFWVIALGHRLTPRAGPSAV
jgi:hypothetical protein